MLRKSFALAVLLLVASTLILVFTPSFPAAHAQDAPGGTIAFVGTGTVSAQVYLLDIGTGQIGPITTPVLPDADLDWQPDGDMLAFTTVDGNYAVLKDLDGCFTAPDGCENVTLFDPDDPVLGVEWSPDGAWLFLQHNDRIAAVPPMATAFSVTLTVDAACNSGLRVSGGDGYLLCAAANNGDNAVDVYQFGAVTGSEIELVQAQDLGSFATLTALAINPTGQVALGTSESGGESGWVASPDTAPQRIAPNQIHIYGLAFTPDQLAVAGAIADSTGDSTLTDGDLGELLFYDYAAGSLTPVEGFTGASGLATSPESESVLVVIEQETLAFYTPSTRTKTPLSVLMPQPGTLIHAVAWQYGTGTLPPVPTATSAPPPTSAPIATAAPATLEPLPTLTPYPTFTPYIPPTLTPYPTFTPYIPPTATPGSPAGVGCQFAYTGGGGLPVAVGDTAQVTGYGAGLRLRTAAGLYHTQLRELTSGTQMTVLNGPQCADGYRWWQVRLDNGTTGWVADSDGGGWWIETAPSAPTETVTFWADRYSISPGECVTLQWAMEGIREVYYQGSGGGEEGVTGYGSRNVCPTTTTTYTLRVVKTDGTTTYPSVTITVGAAGLPDLVVYQIDHMPQTPNAGDIMQVRVRFRNDGSAPATAPFTVVWYPGTMFMAPACIWDVTDTLAPGATDKVNCNYQYTSSHGSIDMMAVVDFGDSVNESNNGNNTLKKTITVN